MADIIDETPGESPSRKRIEKSADRTHAWLRDTLASRARNSEDVTDFNAEQLNGIRISDTTLFAAIPPLAAEEQHLYLADLSSMDEDGFLPHISGLALYSTASIDILPKQVMHLPRLGLQATNSPQDILKSLSLGIDLTTIVFGTTAAEDGIALSFDFSKTLPEENVTAPNRSDTRRPLGIDLWSSAHSTSLIPLTAKCTCYTCTHHHRAYITHLLSAKEMLAWTLLQLHNYHVLDTFFASIRSSIAAGTFAEDVKTFERTYEDDLPAATGEGPRTRGYQLKSMAGGQPKMNRKAYGRLEAVADARDGIAGPTDEQDATTFQERGFAEKMG